MRSGLVFNIQKYSVHDGPGIRTTVFLKGCPLRCHWCHNPESISHGREVVVIETRCIGCGECRLVCPHSAALPGEGVVIPAKDLCDLCGACVEVCPTRARQLVGREMTVDAVMEAVLQDRVFYEESGGGVTFSGGEPLSQPEFLLGLLRAARNAGLHTAVDTCGLARPDHLLPIMPLTDLFLFDLKVMDGERHEQYTGAPNGLILENLHTLGRAGVDIWIRVPVIPGMNDDAANLEAKARLIAGLPGVSQVNLLPYHRTGVSKARRIGRADLMGETAPASPELLSRTAEIFRSFGLEVKTGG